VTPLETIEALTSEQTSVVARSSNDTSVAQVLEAAGFRWLLNGGSSVQSLMSVDSPAALLLPNHVAMLFGLLLVESADSILSLGMGGGSFERFLHKQYPNSSIISVEPDKEIIRLARECFGIPSSVQVASSSAEEFVSKTNQQFDLVLCDIFERESHPACLTSPSFYQDIKSIVGPGGVLALNTTPHSQNEMLDILQSLRSSFSVVYLATIHSRGNVVVIAKNGVAEPTDVIYSRTDVFFESTDVSLAEWVNKFKLIPF
jgi:spermidine synthase